MIEFGCTLLLVACAFLVFYLADPLRDIARGVCELLDGIDTHRRAQAGSVLKHSGLLDLQDEEAE